MQPDFEPFEVAADHLRADLAPVHLADAGSVRRRGDRRGRNQLTVTVVGVAVLIAAMVGGTWMVTAGTGTSFTPATEPAATETSASPTDPSVTPTAPPTVTPPRIASPTTSPAKPTTRRATTPPTSRTLGTGPHRMLPELRSANQNAGERPYLAPPRPCGTAQRPSDDAVTWSMTAWGVISYESQPGRPAPELTIAYVGQYRQGGAAAYLAELREDLTACPGTIGEGNSPDSFQWSIVDEGFAGDDSVLLKLRGGAEGYADEQRLGIVYVGVARVGTSVVTVADLGWEGYNGIEAFTRQKLAALVALQK